MRQFTHILALATWLVCHTSAQAQTITTFAGSGASLGDGGPATAANLVAPAYVAADATGNVYINDPSANRIRMVNTTGTISTFAGNGTAGSSGDGGMATAAEINGGPYANPSGGVAAADGNVYLVDSWNNVIRKINSSGIITRICGTGSAGFIGDGGPAISAEIDSAGGITVDASGNIYFADTKNNRIRKINTLGIISTVAGNGTASFSGDGGAATLAAISNPLDVKIDASGNLYIFDADNYRVRKVNTSGIISTAAGNGYGTTYISGSAATASAIPWYGGLAIDGGGNLFIAGGELVLRVDRSTGIMTTVAGKVDSFGFSGDGGPATNAKLSEVYDATFDSYGNLYIADGANARVRKIALVGEPEAVPVLSSHAGAITIIPDPNAGVFTVSGSIGETTSAPATINILDMTGSVVYSTQEATAQGKINAQLQTGNIADGQYILIINCGSATIASRFVVVR